MVIATNDHPKVGATEVSPKATRRRFTAKYKRKVLLEADATEPGELAAMLRREGLYSSQITKWRQARERGELDALSPNKRGPRARSRDARDEKIAKLERDNAKLKAKLERAEIIIEVQKKVSQLIGVPLADEEVK